ncbi:MAG TPA: 4Fe-4S dicluster domain-containing protein [Candidatus Paceibacterota bacterium]|nr:4Fe-4S dicluster domain-containing protein [Verrucomicrobiota bacterium]HRY47393.1 4Fe-4S dicluster domain-containing protein [Candidatus Paceibacterota bacterium]HSA00967.1 4Fe-4S dicluster domain-containing protein [Candidatus Paceibacterota bacterium]
MRARILPQSDLLNLVDLLRQEYEVVAPFCDRGRDTYFDVVNDDNRARIQVHLPHPFYPPKRWVIPHLERLFKIRTGPGQAEITPYYHEVKRAIFGIRSCDIAGIHHLDRFYLGRDFRDIYYEYRRRNLFLVNVVCTDVERDISDICFCMCADTGPAARDHFDVQLMDLGTEFLALAGTPAGEALLAQPLFRPATAAHVNQRRAILTRVRQSFKTTTSWFSAAINLVSQGRVTEKTWEDIGNRCLECGGCTYVCPACTCFTVTDRQIGPQEIERVRLWDACALNGFTRMAGGFNPRKAVHDRRNRRFFRKLSHYFIQRELSMACVGCGRCAAVCHGDVGMPSVVEMMRRQAAAATHESTGH